MVRPSDNCAPSVWGGKNSNENVRPAARRSDTLAMAAAHATGLDRANQVKRAAPSGAGDQWRKWRSPVKTMAIPCSSAASITSASRMLPPGWITAVMPAAAAASSPSWNGK